MTNFTDLLYELRLMIFEHKTKNHMKLRINNLKNLLKFPEFELHVQNGWYINCTRKYCIPHCLNFFK